MRGLLIESVDTSDDMVLHMMALCKDVYDGYTQPTFDALIQQRCDIVSVQRTHKGRRALYHVRSAGLSRT